MTPAAQLAASLHLPTTAVIGGRPVAAASGKTFATINPATGEELAQIADCDSVDVDRAVAAARAAFDGPWGHMSQGDRKRLMLRFATLIEAHATELATIETLEGGKPIDDTANIDLVESIDVIRWHAEAADKVNDLLTPSGPGVVSMIVREPIGVVGVVLPWNFPMLMAAWKLGPILATGNTCVLKPAEQTSITTVRLAELAVEAGIPDGVINVVTGFGPSVGEPLGRHLDVDAVSFTGSTETGRRFLHYSAESNLKEVVLECGGKNPFVVMADADNLDRIADHAATSIFWNGGQNCSSNSRLIVHQAVKDELLELIVEKARDWPVGDPLDPETRIGAMIEADHLTKVLDNITSANDDGADCVLGGHRTLEDSGGYFVEPTIFTNVDPSMRIAKEEVFGPVLSVIDFSQPEDGIRIANDTPYGLAASVFTSDLRTAHLAARAIKAGTVSVNSYAEGDVSTPFGGFGLSGFGGRDKSLHAHDQYTQLKTIWIDLG
ncbi:MAG: aldehyde dehydrogenase [Acidimicrobiales bacterium]|nr:aldehyde dehydrogenase [Acidimicrobiales bacterium]